jgi:hypothetical protein
MKRGPAVQCHRLELGLALAIGVLGAPAGVDPVTAAPPTSECDILGTEGPDTLVGTAAGETICGL